MNSYHTEAKSLTETQLRENIAELENKHEAGQMTARDATRMMELKAALNNIKAAIRLW